ncbi:ATP-binding protein [Nocardioides sp. WL0053]|uniref:ATP-binding protein n=1 Tax=Nocardioides jiangsuensis TaxID=2866161 RepID=A0ABS7RMW2_9ACTN|nr:ATP-binding protein [Nocardioides jiangsuensis]MBY9076393.1 ATP-binding protein [Nocardioides jiangsuensis]
MRARVIVVAGPSGSGKSRLSRRLGLSVLNLDDFYKDGSDPTLPRLPMGVVDWDHPGSWLHDDALAAIETLCHRGEADVPIYDISRDGRVGHHRLSLDGAPYFVAEGIFAQEIVRECVARGLLAEAICVSNHRLVTFWRRLTRDLREHRKPPWVLLRRGLMLLRAEPRVIAHAVELGCTPMAVERAYDRIHELVAGPVPLHG